MVTRALRGSIRPFILYSEPFLRQENDFFLLTRFYRYKS